MKLSNLALLFLSSSVLYQGIEGNSSCASSPKSSSCTGELDSTNPEDVPFVAARTLSSNGEKVLIHDDNNKDEPSHNQLQDVYGCCSNSKTDEGGDDGLEPKLIGKMYQMTSEETLNVLKQAREVGWQGGVGEWPQMSLEGRLECMHNFLGKLQMVREQIIETLMWEIGKNEKDAAAEFDRTIRFVEQIMEVLRSHEEFGRSSFQTVSNNVRAMVKRAAIGIVLCLGPYNYPLNETYAAMIPALLTGNIVLLKLPTTGGLSHLLTMQAFVESFPPHTVNFISGGGRVTMPPLMETGHVDALAFIGSSRAADNLIKSHPNPHRLKLFLQLEAKNMGIFLPDILTNPDKLQHSLDEAVTGSLSFNGQRCTALKLLFVPKESGKINNDIDDNGSPAQYLANEISQRVEKLTIGLPWQKHSDDNNNNKQPHSQITPLPYQERVTYMKQLIADAVEKGASILNENGGKIIGGPKSTLMIPAVLFPVTKDMNIYHEEQFGPIVPIVEYDDLNVVLEYATQGKYGQQVSIFTASEEDSSPAAGLIDFFSNIFGKININSQCGRSPDTLPFSGRRSSAMGVMSVTEVLKEFSVPTVISYKETKNNERQMVEGAIQPSSTFMSTLS
mmetsp:Transcript_9950/g.9634  ORF Transcript_9950/g.9634 Transcript_9950/m.9634 type:complete len:617 (-) Transcript_9950:164-2014(-)|eukprot:CAMPEP_0197825704 /NCGR_PEP_ID=MMETSP1437-20131217/2740_1 /TAXON_ID=49252 ORGANISM="Eucampia antarctica, Strain CCMP1452" /NCGR_SAMPLE_ID=MMETSP1437 /ASSEMBLY_ACC=CAM_ASM_001096 /LENGTH=616 /DNA_ID=CAMNT_0043425819 /DNA_START=66 /DNA_END=1916 /DNA_ORIENTATION=-